MNTTPVARLDGPGDLLASVPAMLRFTPDDSLVLIAVTEGKVSTVIRLTWRRPTTPHAHWYWSSSSRTQPPLRRQPARSLSSWTRPHARCWSSD